MPQRQSSAKPGALRTTLDLESSGARLQLPIHRRSPGDRRFLRALYLDTTGRTPLPSEWEAAHGKSRQEVITSQVGGLPFFEGLYEEELFYFLLVDNFRPSTDAFDTLPRRLTERRLSIRDAIRQIVSSQFFNARNPGPDTFVTVVMEQLLGLTVQERRNVRVLEAGKRMYDGRSAVFLGAKGSSQADLVRIAVENERFEPFLVERHFHAIFRQEMPRAARDRDARRLREDPLCWPEIVGGWFASAAYEQCLGTPRPKSDRAFVQGLFVDLLGRPPQYQEYRRCRNALRALSDSRPLRSVVVKLILDSDLADLPETGSAPAEKLVDELFLEYLCREPTQSEHSAVVAALDSGEATPRTLIRALLTHWEYQHY